jgi:hypothetical protein
MKSFIICTVHLIYYDYYYHYCYYYYSEYDREVVIGGTCNTHGSDKYITMCHSD